MKTRYFASVGKSASERTVGSGNLFSNWARGLISWEAHQLYREHDRPRDFSLRSWFSQPCWSPKPSWCASLTPPNFFFRLLYISLLLTLPLAHGFLCWWTLDAIFPYILQLFLILMGLPIQHSQAILHSKFLLYFLLPRFAKV